MPSKSATAPKTLNALEKATSPSVSFRLLSSSYIRAALVAVSALGLTGYWFRQALIDFALGVRDGVIGSLGLGLLPVALWMAVAGWALAKRRSWFRLRRLRLWASSLALVLLVLGILSFFHPIRGSLAAFTLWGEVSLGGRIGEAITAPVAWLGIIKLAGLFVAGVSMAAPPLAASAAILMARLAVSAYVVSVMLVRSIVKMYRLDRRSPDEQPTMAMALRDNTSLAPNPPGHVAPRQLDEDEPPVMASTLSPRRGPVIIYPDGHASSGDYDDAEPDMDEEDDSESYEAPVIEHERRVDATAHFDDEDEEQLADDDWDEDGDLESRAAEDDEPLASLETDEASENSEKPFQQYRTLEWQKPPLEIMQNGLEEGITEREMLETAETIKRTLAEYGVEVEIGQIRPGPTVTMYGLIPGWVRRHKQVKELDANGRPKLDMFGKPIISQVEQKTRVKVDAILSREKDLALALKTPSIRIETPVMGKSQVGIEVPNPKPSVVTLRAVMESEEFRRLLTKAHLPVALGKGSGGETVVIDLAKMPHLLIAGATGSGKSVCLNAIVSCLILEKTPADLRLLLIDPKRVELTPYNGIPHLLCPVVVDTDKVVGVLKGVIREMLDRYRRMEEVGVRNIEAFNKKSSEKLPFLVVVVDELADLMMTAAFDVEQSLCRLAQLGRATGIHLIVATQRPSVDVVTGLIKANFPSRISFAVTSQVDSRTILDATGAEKLMGRGDMLYLPIDGSRPSRVQGVFISDREIESLVHFWQTTPWAPTPRIHLRAEPGEDEDDGDDYIAEGSSDELITKAIQLAQTHNKLSTSLLQRRLRIGYPRAARLMDELEEKGIVGPSDGSKSRDVIMNRP